MHKLIKSIRYGLAYGMGSNKLAELIDAYADKRFQETLNHRAGIIKNLKDDLEKAQGFKTYVHNRLDQAGVPEFQEQNATTGCRIGARLDYLLPARNQTPSAVASQSDPSKVDISRD